MEALRRLPKHTELISSLRRDPTERGLSDLDVKYYIVPVDPNDLVNIGLVLVPVEEGIAVLPYTAVLPEEGFEQLNLRDAHLLDPERAEYYLRLLEGELATLMEARLLLEKATEQRGGGDSRE